jgi:uncharacterized repeat protein (TIGR03803 family)
MALLLAVGAKAQTFTTLYNFTGSSDGGYPFGGVVRDAAGNLYGTTYYAGSSYYGVVFKVVPSTQTETVLYSFTGGSDGGYPYCSVILSGGNLYGTTYYAGASGEGVVFEVPTAGGSETVLHSFTGSPDGEYPFSGLVIGPKGTLYGATDDGGSSGYGTVYQVAANGNEKVLFSFDYTDGGFPYQSFACDTGCDDLYGTTEEGGTYGYGTLFKYNRDKKTETVLHSFDYSTTDGAYPYAGSLIRDAQGNLYGVAQEGGSNYYGVVYKISKTGTETILYNFDYSNSGGYPIGSLAIDKKGNLYGATEDGGANGYGTIWKLTPGGTFTVLHAFSYSDGGYPYAGVMRTANGTLFGTTYLGGTDGYGTVFSLVP